MSCRGMLRRLSDYLDRDLDPALCRELDRHMADCRPCRALLSTLRRTTVLLRRLPPARAPRSARAALRRRLRALALRHGR